MEKISFEFHARGQRPSTGFPCGLSLSLFLHSFTRRSTSPPDGRGEWARRNARRGARGVPGEQQQQQLALSGAEPAEPPEHGARPGYRCSLRRGGDNDDRRRRVFFLFSFSYSNADLVDRRRACTRFSLRHDFVPRARRVSSSERFFSPRSSIR